MCDSAQQKMPVVKVGRREMNRTEREKMLAGEPYNAWDEELYALRIECRKTLQRLNNAIPDSTEWREAIDQLIPHSQGAYLEPPFRCDYGANITLGKNFYANFNCVVLDVAPVVIGNNVWLGGGVIVCPGVTIGDNSVIGAGSVVTKNVPANVVAAGNPCRVIRALDSTI
ncbi:sugar O-acetyltransferase [Vibrio vulnificus]